VFQGLRCTLLAPIPITIVGEAEGTHVLPPIIPLPIPGEGAIQVPLATDVERSLRERKKRRKGMKQLKKLEEDAARRMEELKEISHSIEE